MQSYRLLGDMKESTFSCSEWWNAWRLNPRLLSLVSELVQCNVDVMMLAGLHTNTSTPRDGETVAWWMSDECPAQQSPWEPSPQTLKEVILCSRPHSPCLWGNTSTTVDKSRNQIRMECAL